MKLASLVLSVLLSIVFSAPALASTPVNVPLSDLGSNFLAPANLNPTSIESLKTHTLLHTVAQVIATFQKAPYKFIYAKPYGTEYDANGKPMRTTSKQALAKAINEMTKGGFNSKSCTVESITMEKQGVSAFRLDCGYNTRLTAKILGAIEITLSHFGDEGSGGVDYTFKANVNWNNSAYTVVPESLEFYYNGGS